MCDTCGCGLTSKTAHEHMSESIEIMQGLMDQNDHQAEHNREHFNARGVLAINLMSGPGAGKTRLLEATIDAMGDSYRFLVIEGDLETENDAARIRARGVPALQISTGSACHLDAGMVHEALHETSLDDVDVLFIENVGNLVCPASFDLGQHRNVVLLSTTEGDDKPAKYPVMFRAADLVVLSKCDLLPLLDDFNTDRAAEYIANLGRQVPVIQASTGKSQSIEAWLAWLETTLALHRQRLLPSRTA
ncbi:MAG: hydrogenase nickel incorporation protein HypB [Pseudomonadales bacterium]|nr:hydrogenase nickel incorporation protein HypB [Pseudomonadales bacterium]